MEGAEEGEEGGEKRVRDGGGRGRRRGRGEERSRREEEEGVCLTHRQHGIEEMSDQRCSALHCVFCLS